MQKRVDTLLRYLIPPSLVLLMTVSVFELFYDLSAYSTAINYFDIYVIVIFAMDLYFRWQERTSVWQYMRVHFLDIIATIPFNLIFFGVNHLNFLRGLRGVRIVARYGRMLRLVRFAARAPRFLRMREHVKETKPTKVQPHEKEMKAVLGFKTILLITINSIMGTGIWFLTAAGAKHAGPASLVSWGILSLISIYIAMCFGELVSMFPKAGGVYEFAKQTYGRFWSFVIGWTTSIAGSVTIAMLLLGAMQYLIPPQYSSWYVPIAIALLLLFNYIAFKGMQTSVYVLVFFALVTLSTITVIIVPGFFTIDPGNYTPFFVFPAMNVLISIFFIAETFFGWESAIFLSAETKNPTKIMPKALVYGTMVIAGLAFLLALTAMGAIPWDNFGQSVAPLKDLGEVYFGMGGRIIFTLLVFTSIVGAVSCWIVTAPRLLMAIAEDKLFFVQFAKIHPRYKSPYISIIFQVIVITALIIVGAGQYETLLHILVPLILTIYSTVLLSVVILRFRKPNHKRPYKVIFGKVGPLLTIVFMFFLLAMFVQETHDAFDILRISASLIVLGIPSYFFIELFYDPKYVELRKQLVTWARHHYHKIPWPGVEGVMQKVGPFDESSTIVAYNAPMGAFTRKLIKKDIPFKHIHAVSQSRHEIQLFKLRIPDEDRKRVTIHHLRRILDIPKSIPKFDLFVAFDTFGYVEDIPKFLKQLHDKLHVGGKFCFHTQHHLLNITPNALIIEDKKKVLRMFKDAGLYARYLKNKSFFTEDILIYGVK